VILLFFVISFVLLFIIIIIIIISFLFLIYVHTITAWAMYTPAQTVRALCSKCRLILLLLLLWQLRHSKDRMPDRHQVSSFYVLSVGLRFCLFGTNIQIILILYESEWSWEMGMDIGRECKMGRVGADQ
jgi:hypothetical protein